MLSKNEIKDFAYSQGAQLVAVTGIESYKSYLEEVQSRLNETGAGHKDYMNPAHGNKPGSEDISFFEQLSDARNTLQKARSIILFGVYGYDHPAQYRNTKNELKGKTARIYSYYPVVRQIAEGVVKLLEAHGHRAIHGQQIPLKHVADQIGLGVYGKNSILQHPQYGSFIAFRNILTEVEILPDQKAEIPSPCEGCDKCIKACPTGALYAPYKVNPCLCLNPIGRREAYIEPRIRSKMQNWIVGCDICQEVCPSNRNLVPRQMDPRAEFDSRFHASHKNLDGFERTPPLLPLLDPNQAEIIRRNAAIALANNGKSPHKVSRALKAQLPNMSPGLKEYFLWAINKIEQNEAVDGI